MLIREFGTIESCNRTQADGSRVVLQDRWDDVEAEDFPKNQWPFLAQVFERDTFRYTIEEQESLPLTKGPKKLNDDNDRNYSWVDEWSVHKDYVTFMEPEVCILFLLPSLIVGHKCKRKH
jgi:hypothetical protein